MRLKRSEDRARVFQMNAKIFQDPALSGQENMDIDALLLERAVAGEAALRFYQWSEPTISLGHFQVTQSMDVPERFKHLPCVKRLSGGGAILHDRELTYSCCLPKQHSICQEPAQLYNQIHEVLIEVLAAYDVRCSMRGDAAFKDQSFLCFSRGDERDIVVGTHKIVGSSQRRRQGAVLQHGSILLQASEFAPEFPGIYELSGVRIDPDELREQLEGSIANRLGLQFL